MAHVVVNLSARNYHNCVAKRSLNDISWMPSIDWSFTVICFD